MKKEIYRKTNIYGYEGEHSITQVAEYEYDQLALDAPCDIVEISVTIKDDNTDTHDVVRLPFERLEAIYLAAKAARNAR